MRQRLFPFMFRFVAWVDGLNFGEFPTHEQALDACKRTRGYHYHVQDKG
jgi:hypothetical protein